MYFLLLPTKNNTLTLAWRGSYEVIEKVGEVDCRTRNRKHRRAAAKPAACAQPLMLSTLGSTGKGMEGEVGKEVERDEGRDGGRRK